MASETYFVVLPTFELQTLNALAGGVHPWAEQGIAWRASIRDRHEIEDAIWTCFMADFDIDGLSATDDPRPFFRDCVRLGFKGCFTVHATMPPNDAEDLFHLASAGQARAERNLEALSAGDSNEQSIYRYEKYQRGVERLRRRE